MSLLWTLPVLLVFGVLAVTPVGALFAYEMDRFGTEIAELVEAAAPSGAQEREPLVDDPAFDAGKAISTVLGRRHHVVDRVRAQREAAARVAAVLRLGFVLVWGFAFVAQAGLARTVFRVVDDRRGPGLWVVPEAWRGVRRGFGTALLFAALFSLAAFLVIGWLGPTASSVLPLTVLTMGFVAAYVAVPARVIDAPGWRAALSRSALLTKGHRVPLFFLWAGLVGLHLVVLLAGPEVTATHDLLPDPATGRGILTPHRAKNLAAWIMATGAVIPPVGALLVCVAHHRLVELRRPSNIEQMTGAFD